MAESYDAHGRILIFAVALQRGGSWIPIGIGALLIGLITAGFVAYRGNWR